MAVDRLKRVNEVLRRELAVVIAKLLVTEGVLVTVTGVDISSDLKNAFTYVSLLGGSPNDHHSIMSQLEKLRPDIQRLMANRVTLKYTPHLHFKEDHSAEEGTRMVQLLDNLDHECPPPSN